MWQTVINLKLRTSIITNNLLRFNDAWTCFYFSTKRIHQQLKPKRVTINQDTL